MLISEFRILYPFAYFFQRFAVFLMMLAQAVHIPCKISAMLSLADTFAAFFSFEIFYFPRLLSHSEKKANTTIYIISYWLTIFKSN